jgi:putative addiction module component (TIGR02574 family)
MTQNAEQLLVDALRLDANARASIAETLLESLDGADEAEVSDAWRAEIPGRAREMDNDTVAAVPGDEVMRELRAKYG